MPKINPYQFAILFIIFFAAQSLIYNNARGSLVDTWVIDKATVKTSAAIINSLQATENVQAVKNKLVSSSAQLSVLNGCEGTESMFLLVAAILAFGAPWYLKVIGVASGVTCIFALNQIRIVCLYFALKYNHVYFHWVHAYIGPTLIILCSGLFFLGWIRLGARSHATL
jgi:exosortase family protein XrtM